ncbi:MAG TPA: AMP-binding protein [Ramlibacter sp.]|uniref:AMP-binding protein n=1 Tax=Ramlibacter sp. TaxID=1917967 RepID=UPI002BA95937|nr:AMP-binding protein [Ramlibacter sp.]HVZ44928.1 AMP-binding protein [Ramlibacter sp.]
MQAFGPPALTLCDLLVCQAAHRPQAEALVDARLRLTWRELHARVEAAAAGLQALGIGRGDKVALLMGNRAEWVIAAFAIARAGAVTVALNTWWTPREMAYALEQSDSVALVCAPRYLKHDYLAAIGELRGSGRIPAVRHRIALGAALPAGWTPWDGVASPKNGAPIGAGPAPDNVAFILYTSGSTAHPKGVLLLHGDMLRNTFQIGQRQALTAGDRVWLAVSLFWGLGCSNALPAAFTHGACVVLQESFDAGEALALIERERCSVLYATPNMVQAMDEHADRATRDLSSLRTGVTIGTAEQIMRAVKLGATEICNVYGLTEIYGNCHVAGRDMPLAQRIACVGPPLPGVRHRIVDLDTGVAVATGELGEIRVKGFVSPGYYRMPEASAAALDEEGFFRTGDLGFVDAQGCLHFRGRVKELVKTGGINVAPAEIEAVLMAHPQIALALVTGVPDAARDEAIAAVIVPRDGATLTEEAVRAYCRGQLAAYKVPSLVCFSRETDLPLTTTGKIQKSRIASTFFPREVAP